tara:strand:- start:249 stop:452 length:204 start_codon:yes stop_codon:yes gene_type:complete
MNKSLEELKSYYERKEAQRLKANAYYRNKYNTNLEYKKKKQAKNRENYLKRKNINNTNNNVVKQIPV